jgi:hypothetical protein
MPVRPCRSFSSPPSLSDRNQAPPLNGYTMRSTGVRPGRRPRPEALYDVFARLPEPALFGRAA